MLRLLARPGPKGPLRHEPRCRFVAAAWRRLRLLPEPHEAMFIVRQTFGKRDAETAASLTIALREAGGAHGPKPLTPKQLDEGLQSASVLVAGASMMFAKWAAEFQSHANQLPLFGAWGHRVATRWARRLASSAAERRLATRRQTSSDPTAPAATPTSATTTRAPPQRPHASSPRAPRPRALPRRAHCACTPCKPTATRRAGTGD